MIQTLEKSTESEPVDAAELPDHLLLWDVSWELYEKLLEETADRRLYITYDEGSLEVMSPSPEHESGKTNLAIWVAVLAEEKNIPIAKRGSTTLKREGLKKGLEPDECYYIQNERAVRGKKRLELPDDPPPDLAVEIETSRRLINRLPIYAALGVPEVWRSDGQRVECLVLGAEGKYQTVDNSRAFPFLRVGELQRFLAMYPEKDETTILRALREWVRTLPA
jgi:Uma2 family endonuclease